MADQPYLFPETQNDDIPISLGQSPSQSSPFTPIFHTISSNDNSFYPPSVSSTESSNLQATIPFAHVSASDSASYCSPSQNAPTPDQPTSVSSVKAESMDTQPPINPQCDPDRLRFQVELEFVQCLSNPNYLHYLAQNGYLRQQTMINYLQYLLYWKKPKYATFIKHPQCLHILELLQSSSFRFYHRNIMVVKAVRFRCKRLCEEIKAKLFHIGRCEVTAFRRIAHQQTIRRELVNPHCAKFIDDQLLLHWQHYTRKRIKLQQAVAEQHAKRLKMQTSINTQQKTYFSSIPQAPKPEDQSTM